MKVRWGKKRRLHPVSNVYGLDRGQAIDRYYIENYLEKHSSDIRGTILELLNENYTVKYGGDRVIRSDVLDLDPENRNATIITDLTKAHQIKDGTYDCFILTQTLQFIYDLPSALYHAYRILKPGGVILVTVPSVSRIDCVAGVEGDYWRFTLASADKLFSQFFPRENVEIEAHGNVLAATSFLMGLAAHELKKQELDYYDPNFPVLICIRAVKPEG